MIEEARATGLYAELEVADMIKGLRARRDASADLIVAADAMVYVADLAPVLAEAKRVLAPGGMLAFTLETHDGERRHHRRRACAMLMRPITCAPQSPGAG